jgi:transcriptional regulator with XRE-family HTH domain
MEEHWRVDSPSDAVVWQLKDLRKKRGWSAAQLAEECAKAGFPQLTESVIANIESGRPDDQGRRRRAVTVDELWAFARTLDVPMGSLLWPLAGRDAGWASALMQFSPRELHLFVNDMRETAAGAQKLLDRLPPEPSEQEGSQ